MKNKKNNEELQSRRQFFKQAAKGALPILGAIVLANAPAVINAAEKDPMGCSRFTCENSCYGSCNATCDTVCSENCLTLCQGGCRGECQGSCKSGCDGSCKGSCGYSSYY